MPKASTFALRLATQMIDSDTFPMLTNAGENVRVPVSEARALVGPGWSDTVNAYNEDEVTDELKIQAGINRCVSTGKTILFIPTSMTPFDASLITFNNGVRHVVEGGDFSVYDVRAYGAAGDDVQDDTIAINAALSALPIGGGTVALGFGIYKISAPLIGKNGAIIQGVSVTATEIKNYANTDCIQFNGVPLGARGIRVSDLFINDALASGSRTAGHGIHLDGTGDATIYVIERVIINQHFDGIRATIGFTSSIRDVRCNIQRNDGFSFYNIGTSTTIQSCFANACVRHGYFAEGGLSYSSFINCAADVCGGDAYHMGAVDADGGFYCSYITFISCGSESGVGHGMYFKDGTGFVILNPRHGPMTGTTKDGIRFDGSNRCTVINGLIFDATGWGINVMTDTIPVTDWVPSDIKIDAIQLHASCVLGAIQDPTKAVVQWSGRAFSVGIPAGTPTAAKLVGVLSSQMGFGQNVLASGETDLLTYAVPANTLGTDAQWLDVTAAGYTAANANNKTVKLRFGGEVVADTGALALNNKTWRIHARIVRNSVTGQFVTGEIGSSDKALLPMIGQYGFLTRDLSTALNIIVTGDGGADGDVTARVLTVDIGT